MAQSTFEERVERALVLQNEQHIASMQKMEEMSVVLTEVRDDVIAIKAKDYNGRINRLDAKVGAHGERIAKTEVRAGFISAFIGGLIGFFFSGFNG